MKIFLTLHHSREDIVILEIEKTAVVGKAETEIAMATTDAEVGRITTLTEAAAVAIPEEVVEAAAVEAVAVEVVAVQVATEEIPEEAEAAEAVAVAAEDVAVAAVNRHSIVTAALQKDQAEVEVEAEITKAHLVTTTNVDESVRLRCI